MVQLTKRFPGIIANDSIDLEIGRKEILAIIGENGAGKSTFCKMLTGLYHPDGGEIYMDGKKVNFSQPSDSMAAGINMVYQERNIVHMLNGAQNICFGNEPKKNGFIDEKAIMEQATELRDRLGLTVPLDVPVENLGAGAQQLIEIMRAFYTNPKLLILDEPTASLGEGEIEPFLKFVTGIKETMDVSVIFISHKIEEVFAIADKIAVFADGKCTLETRTADTTPDECIRAMLRSDKIKPIEVPEKDTDKLEPLLEMRTAFYDGKEHELNIRIGKGEVVGFYGLVGSGRTECFETFFGLRRTKRTDYVFNGEAVNPTSPIDMIGKGVVMTPEKRADGMFKSLSLVDNICNLFMTEKLAGKRSGVINQKKCRDFAKEVLEKNNVKYTRMGQSIAELSGGNIQKIIVGRSIAVDNIRLLILDEPTAGIDIGAKHEMYGRMRDLADSEGISIAFISSELDELMAICDRLYVFADGNVLTDFRRAEFDKGTIVGTAIKGKRPA